MELGQAGDDSVDPSIWVAACASLAAHCGMPSRVAAGPSLMLRCLAVLLATAFTGTVSAELRPLTGSEIISQFPGATIAGAYANGTPFRETYREDGSLSYTDPRGTVSGRWFVTQDQFCMAYADMQGGCFSVLRISSNCFDFFAKAQLDGTAPESNGGDGSTKRPETTPGPPPGTADSAPQPLEKPRYIARGALEGAPSTCPDELQV